MSRIVDEPYFTYSAYAVSYTHLDVYKRQPQGYAKDSRQVYFHNGDGKVKIIKGAEVSSFRSLGDTYFARDEKRIYAYGKQLSKADLTAWELLSHWYSRDARDVYKRQVHHRCV